MTVLIHSNMLITHLSSSPTQKSALPLLRSFSFVKMAEVFGAANLPCDARARCSGAAGGGSVAVAEARTAVADKPVTCLTHLFPAGTTGEGWVTTVSIYWDKHQKGNSHLL